MGLGFGAAVGVGVGDGIWISLLKGVGLNDSAGFSTGATVDMGVGAGVFLDSAAAAVSALIQTTFCKFARGSSRLPRASVSRTARWATVTSATFVQKRVSRDITCSFPPSSRCPPY